MGSRKRFNRVLAWVLAVATIAGSVPATVFASDDYDIVVDGDNSDYSVTVDDSSGEKEITQNSGQNSTGESPSFEQSSAVQSENGQKEQTSSDNDSSVEEKTQASGEGLVFSSKRLLVMTKKKSAIPDGSNILSSYQDVYLLSYDTEDEAKYYDTEKSLQYLRSKGEISS